MNNSWFKSVRSYDALELIKSSPQAFSLAYIIAYRARYTEGFNSDGLEKGEAMLGDHENYGMSARQYRTAKQQLAKWRFATFKTTSRGTLGKLVDTRLFDPLNIASDKLGDSQPTGRRQAADRRATTNNNLIKSKNEEEGESPLGSVEEWKLAKDRARIKKSIQEEMERIKPNFDVIAGLQAELGKINAEYKRRGKSVTLSAAERPSRLGAQKAIMTDEQRVAYLAELHQLKDTLSPRDKLLE